MSREVNEPRFDIGTVFTTRHEHPRVCTVTNILRTYDITGTLVRVRYIAAHEFMGQLVINSDVVDATIALGLRKETV